MLNRKEFKKIKEESKLNINYSEYRIMITCLELELNNQEIINYLNGLNTMFNKKDYTEYILDEFKKEVKIVERRKGVGNFNREIKLYLELIVPTTSVMILLLAFSNTYLRLGFLLIGVFYSFYLVWKHIKEDSDKIKEAEKEQYHNEALSILDFASREENKYINTFQVMNKNVYLKHVKYYEVGLSERYVNDNAIGEIRRVYINNTETDYLILGIDNDYRRYENKFSFHRYQCELYNDKIGISLKTIKYHLFKLVETMSC